MNQYLQKITALFEKIKNAQISYDKIGIKPVRDWNVILISSFVIFCVCALLAFVFYVQVDTGKFFTVMDQSTVTEVKINDPLFRKTVEDINKREYSLGALRLNRSAPKDPSL